MAKKTVRFIEPGTRIWFLQRMLRISSKRCKECGGLTCPSRQKHYWRVATKKEIGGVQITIDCNETNIKYHPKGSAGYFWLHAKEVFDNEDKARREAERRNAKEKETC